METNQEEQNEMFGGIFNQTENDIKPQKSIGAELDPDYYRPSTTHENAKDGVYESIIRFVPNALERNLQMVSKYVYFFDDIVDPNNKIVIDCASNWGVNNNIISNSYKMLKEFESASIRRIVKNNFTRKLYYWRLIHIITDKQQSEIENQIKIFRHSKQIQDKIELQAKAKPDGRPGCIVTDPFNGKDFLLNIEEKIGDNNMKITSYEKSSFDDERNSILINGSRLIQSQENMKLIFEFLKQNSPDISKANYKQWTPEDEQKILEHVRHLLEDNTIFDKVYKKTYGKSFIGGISVEKSVEKSVDKSLKKEINKEESKSESVQISESAKAEAPEENFDVSNLEINFDDIP